MFEGPVVELEVTGKADQLWEGSDLRLQCSTCDVYPPPKLTWSHQNGTVIQSTDGTLERCSTLELPIDDLEYPKHDNAVFSCSAFNGIGQPKAKETVVTIKSKAFQIMLLNFIF